MVINKKASKIQNFFELLFVGAIFIGTIFVILSYDLATLFFISLHPIIEVSIVLAKYLPFSQLYIAGFQIKSFSHI